MTQVLAIVAKQAETVSTLIAQAQAQTTPAPTTVIAARPQVVYKKGPKSLDETDWCG